MCYAKSKLGGEPREKAARVKLKLLELPEENTAVI